MRDYYEKSSFSNLDKEVFPSLLAKLFSSGRAFTRAHACNGFELTGIYPINQNRVKRSLLSIIVSEKNDSIHQGIESSNNIRENLVPKSTEQTESSIEISPELLLEKAKTSLETSLKNHFKLSLAPKKKIKKQI